MLKRLTNKAHIAEAGSARGFDIAATEAHYLGVRSYPRISLLLVAVLVAWNGMLLSVPHKHADIAVPQEELACSASHPSSKTNHLHDSGRLLSPHLCVACLAGSNVAASPGIATIAAMVPSVAGEAIDLAVGRPHLHTRLPLTRGPPPTV